MAARGGNELAWPAQIRDLSQGGMGLILNRRFEPGTGLAVEIPETDNYPADTLLARVVHATRQPHEKWLLGCAFVSPLSDDELQRLLTLGRGDHALAGADFFVQEETANDEPFVAELVIAEVYWEGPDANGQLSRKLYRRLNFTGNWPLGHGAMLDVWTGQDPEHRRRVVVDRCYQHEARWIISYGNPKPSPTR